MLSFIWHVKCYQFKRLSVPRNFFLCVYFLSVSVYVSGATLSLKRHIVPVCIQFEFHVTSFNIWISSLPLFILHAKRILVLDIRWTCLYCTWIPLFSSFSSIVFSVLRILVKRFPLWVFDNLLVLNVTSSSYFKFPLFVSWKSSLSSAVFRVS